MSDLQHEAYRPLVEDGWGLFPEDFRVKAPKGFNEAVRAAAQRLSPCQATSRNKRASSLTDACGRECSQKRIISEAPMSMQMTILAPLFSIAAIALILVGSSPTFAESTCGNLPALTEGSSKDVKVDYLMRRAFACVQEGKPPLSVEIFSEIISIDPENEAAYLNRGSAYLQTGQPDSAIADFSKAISFKPDGVQAWYNRGIAFILLRKFERGVADLGEVIRLQPNFACAYCNRGLGLVRNGDLEKAKADLDTGIQKDPNLPLCYYARGDLYFEERQYENAIADFTKGLKLTPNIEGLSKRGMAYERLGQHDKALEDFNEVLKIAPTFKDALDGVKRLSQGQN